MNSEQRQRPPRPLGLAMAIIASTLLFALLPFMQLSMAAIVDLRLQQQPLVIPDGQGGTTEMLAAGTAFSDVEPTQLVIQALLAAGFVGVAVAAWTVRRPIVRRIFTAVVIGYSALTVITAVFPLFVPVDLTQGLDSGDAVRRPLIITQTVITLLVLLYVIWYINRAPSRAFYRGCYLAHPPAAEQAEAGR